MLHTAPLTNQLSLSLTSLYKLSKFNMHSQIIHGVLYTMILKHFKYVESMIVIMASFYIIPSPITITDYSYNDLRWYQSWAHFPGKLEPMNYHTDAFYFLATRGLTLWL